MTLSRESAKPISEGEDKMRTWLATLGLLILGVSGCASVIPAQDPQIDRTPIDAAIDKTVADGAFPLLYVRVEKLDGSLVYEHSAINPEFSSMAPTGESWMRLWSMSKSVTIAVILDLEEDGVLSRTDPVTDYIPGIRSHDGSKLRRRQQDVRCGRQSA